MRMVIATWVVGAKIKNWEQSEYLSVVDEYLGKWSCIHAEDCYVVIRKDNF